ELSRGGQTRTAGLRVPNAMLYQAELRPAMERLATRHDRISTAEPKEPVIGYTMVLVASTLFGVNGVVSKGALSPGLSSLRLSEARSAGACLALTAIALVRSPSSLRVRPGELPRLALFGVVAVALVQLLYFLAIDRLPVGIALLIQYLGPVLVALWAR